MSSCTSAGRMPGPCSVPVPSHSHSRPPPGQSLTSLKTPRPSTSVVPHSMRTIRGDDAALSECTFRVYEDPAGTAEPRAHQIGLCSGPGGTVGPVESGRARPAVARHLVLTLRSPPGPWPETPGLPTLYHP